MPEPSRAPATLILVPTEGEERRLAELGGFPPELGSRERCGFGPVAAAARAAELVERERPRRVLLVGIAGSYAPERAPVGSAHAFARVRLEGVGAGEGPELLGPAELGFAQWDGPPGEPVHDSLRLVGPGESLLLTVCAASATPSEAEARRRRHPEVLAEDMEGFGVALACHLLAVPLVVVRGISNRTGNRDLPSWRVREALAAARAVALEWLERDDWSGP